MKLNTKTLLSLSLSLSLFFLACQKEEIVPIKEELGSVPPASWISYKVNGEEILLLEEIEVFSLDGIFRLSGTTIGRSDLITIDIPEFKEWKKEYEIQSMLVETFHNDFLYSAGGIQLNRGTGKIFIEEFDNYHAKGTFEFTSAIPEPSYPTTMEPITVTQGEFHFDRRG